MEFRWKPWNTAHIQRHGVSPEEAEKVIQNAVRPYPLQRDNDKWLVWGPGRGGRLLQAVYVLDEQDRVFVIHARPLTEREKKQLRRRSRP